jgi:hypothetical protein
MDVQQVKSVVNSPEWQFLGTILGFSADQLATAATALENASIKADPSAKQVSVKFESLKLYGYDVVKNGTIGISIGNNLSPSLFIEGTTVKIPSPISSDVYSVDVRVVFSSGGNGVSALISGTINQTVLDVPVINLTLSDPLIIVGVNSLTPEIPTVGFGGDMTLGSSLDLSGVVLFVSKDPKNSVLLASVSTLSLETIAECFPGVDSVPAVMKPLLNSVSLTGPSNESFSINVGSGTTYAGLADDLDAKQLDRVAVAFKQYGSVVLPADPDAVALQPQRRHAPPLSAREKRRRHDNSSDGRCADLCGVDGRHGRRQQFQAGHGRAGPRGHPWHRRRCRCAG